tara:strand:+ start:269 stop:412 length:144 start_codon:yes stop_codon:yes gene_type:complete
MGQHADDAIIGLTCQSCGGFFADYTAIGHPRTCEDCEPKGNEDNELI